VSREGGAKAVQISRLVLDIEGRSVIISSWWSTIIMHNIAAIIAMRFDWGLVPKVRSRVAKSIIGLVHLSQGNMSMIKAEGWSIVTSRESTRDDCSGNTTDELSDW